MSLWQSHRRLDVRLFASYAAVAIISAATFALVNRIALPAAFSSHFKAMQHATGSQMTDVGMDPRPAVRAASDAAFQLALTVSLVLAGILAALTTRRLLHPLRDVQNATRRLASGHYNERLVAPRETELASLANDVNALASTLEAAEHRRVDLVRDVTHEMRTPLTVVEGYVEGLGDGLLEPSKEIFDAVRHEVGRLRNLINDLSLLSSLEETTVHLRLEPSDLSSVVAGACDRLRHQYETKGVTLACSAANGVPVNVDRGRIEQIVVNLCANALVYTPEGGRVRLETSIDGDFAQLTVTDTGRGIAAENVARIFDRFYRVSDAERPPGGSGIGLAIARALAEVHHGTLAARSDGLGHGSTFTLRLPLSTAPTTKGTDL